MRVSGLPKRSNRRISDRSYGSPAYASNQYEPGATANETVRKRRRVDDQAALCATRQAKVNAALGVVNTAAQSAAQRATGNEDTPPNTARLNALHGFGLSSIVPSKKSELGFSPSEGVQEALRQMLPRPLDMVVDDEQSRPFARAFDRLFEQAVARSAIGDVVPGEPGVHPCVSTFVDVAVLMHSENRPKTVADVLTAAVDIAERYVAADIDPQSRQLLVTGCALSALAAHTQRADAAIMDAHHVRRLLPHLAPDGRSDDYGFDKTWHLINNIAFSFFYLADRHFGSGLYSATARTASALSSSLKQIEEIEATYNRTKGAWGTYIGNVGYDKADIMSPVYVVAPADLPPDAMEAYQIAVTFGHLHELITTDGGFTRASEIGAGKPTADYCGKDVFSGLADPGVAFDLAANRLGAEIGARAFLSPASLQLDVLRSIEKQHVSSPS